MMRRGALHFNALFLLGFMLFGCGLDVRESG